jgi:protein TonB
LQPRFRRGKIGRADATHFPKKTIFPLAASTYRLRTSQDETPPGRRASGMALAIAVNVLLVLALLGIGMRPTEPPRSSGALVVDLITESAPAPSPASAARQAPRPQLPKPPIVLPVKPSIASPPKLAMLELTREEFAAADIAKLPKSEPSTGDGGADDSEAVGRGPNGEVLYAAEWARRPTATELGGYLPANAPQGSGLVACRTIPGDRVEDCVELDNDPPGSHLARAVRLAAWQFRVRPPRKNGRPQVGEWVMIRIFYNRGKDDR